MSNCLIFWHRPHDGYTEHLWYEEPDAYGQHSGRVSDGYFRPQDLRYDGDFIWFSNMLLFRSEEEAQDYSDFAIQD